MSAVQIADRERNIINGPSCCGGHNSPHPMINNTMWIHPNAKAFDKKRLEQMCLGLLHKLTERAAARPNTVTTALSFVMAGSGWDTPVLEMS